MVRRRSPDNSFEGSVIQHSVTQRYILFLSNSLDSYHVEIHVFSSLAILKGA